MSGLFDAEAYAFDPLGLPFVASTAAVAGLLLYLLFTRGHPLLRMALLVATVAGLLFNGAQAAALMCVDPGVATSLYKLSVAPVSLIGPALFAVTLGAGNRLQPFRWLLVVGIATAALSSVVTLATDLMVDGVWRTSWGVLYTRGGPLNQAHVAVMLAWVVAGFVLAARGLRASGRTAERARYRRIAIVLVSAPLAAADALLALRIGVYPFSFLPTLAICAVGVQAARGGELIRRRGRDWATLWEVAIIAALAIGVFSAYTLMPAGAPALTVALAVAVMAVAHVGVRELRARGRRRSTDIDRVADRALDELAARVAELRDVVRLVAEVRDYLSDRLDFATARLLEVRAAGLVEPTDDDRDEDEPVAPAGPFDPRVRAWLLANRGPLLLDRIDMLPLGGLRAPITDFLREHDAELVLPLIDRDDFIGLIVAGGHAGGRVLDDSATSEIARFQHAIAAAFLSLRLYREAEARVEVAREVEIAAAVQQARNPGLDRRALEGCEIVSHYQPAGQFGGDWWSVTELPDGRVLLVIGDVTGHGVPAALVTATVEGGCETARTILGAGFDVFDLLHLLNRAVLDVGKSRYLMSCFAAAIDFDDMTVTFANAGHPFPYRCRAGGDGGAGQLRALVSRGTPLGCEAQPMLGVARLDLAPGDALVFYTDALVESEDATGRRYGERRLQRLLRTCAGAGDGLCELIIDDARAHYGDVPIREDITLVCLRVGRG